MVKRMTTMLLIAVLASCSQNSNIFDAEVVVSSPLSSIKLEPQIIELSGFDLLGVTDIQIFDSIMVFKSSKPSSPCMLHTYSLNDGKFCGSFVAHGRGANEILSPLMRGYSENCSGDILVDLFDLGQNSAHVWNLSESIATQKTVLLSSCRMKELTLNMFRKDSLYITLNPTISDFHCSIFENTQSSRDVISLYPAVSGIGYSDKLSSASGLNKHKDVLAMAMMMSPQVNFLNLNTKEKKTVAITKDYQNMRERLDRDISEQYIYYIDCTQSENSFFGLYIEACYEDWVHVDYDSKIHVFDWESKLMHEINVDEKLKAIAYCELTDCLYAIDNDDHLYCYSLIFSNLVSK